MGRKSGLKMKKVDLSAIIKADDRSRNQRQSSEETALQ